jgi:hypothetical protein
MAGVLAWVVESRGCCAARWMLSADSGLQRRSIAIEQAGEEEGDSSRGPSDQHGLERATEPASANKLSFQGSEDGKCEQRNDDGELKCFEVVLHDHIWEKRDEPAGDV